MLLAELGYSFEEIGDEGKTDLTVVTPTSPPVVVEPPVIGPPVVVDPQPIKPKPPVVKPELPSGTVAETIDYDENGKWIITNPANDMLTLEHGDIKIKIPIEFKAKKMGSSMDPKSESTLSIKNYG
ncbi:hypothetical protein OL548_33770 (plasmid) [Lysinibacillus sp. MHQ-1]|nr:hypothetical protein OL548_33770 [Lysinibacillus sp. MHQ-1]